MRRTLAATIAALALWAIAAQAASAHALLQLSDPAPNSVLSTAPAAVTLTFTETPDPRLSSIDILDSRGQSVASGSVSAVPGAPDALRVAVRSLPDGVYTVVWRAFSAVDSHISDGSYPFSVGTGTAPPPAVSAAAASGSESVGLGESPGLVLARWLLYIGLLGLLGAAFLGVVLLPAELRLPLKLAAAQLVVAFAGSVLLVTFQIRDAGASLADLPATSLGRDAILRLTPLVLASGLLAAATDAPPRFIRPLLAATGLLAAAALLVEALLSHAASQTLAPAQIAIQWLHLAAIGLWLGGLAALLLQVRGPSAPAKGALARRFAVFAGFGLAIVALTGVIRAVVDIGSVDALVATDFGRLVLLKAALLVPIAALGALNHFRNVPRVATQTRSLSRAGSVELALGVIVLLVASVLVTGVPPAEVAAANQGQGQGPARSAAAASPLQIGGADYGTTIRLTLTASPGTVGLNDFEVRVVDYDTGAIVDATAIRLTFNLVGRSDIGSSTLSLQRRSAGTFAGRGANLSMNGIWRISALVSQPATATQVDMSLGVQQVDVNAVAGLPTIYSVHLDGGRSVQVYLDPAKPGSNLLHATWFDAAGKEMPVSDASMTQISPSGFYKTLQPQILDPGHEAAPVEVASLPASFVLSATGPGGVQLLTQLQISQSS